MQYAIDLHLHSKYSRAVSKMMTLPLMSQVAKEKGLDILTVSDWTHPVWMKESLPLLAEEGDGVYTLKADLSEKKTRFIFTTEISCIFKQHNKLRRIHNLVFAPSIESAEKISQELLKRGANLSSDGRPIIGLSSKQLLELVLEVDEKALLIPCHIWTPHFGMYGSASGFESIAESFEDLSQYIYGIETGLSSDPEMNWEVPELKTRSILSFSDAHSPAKMAREATIMELSKPDYPSIREAIMLPSKSNSSTTSSEVNDSPRGKHDTLATRGASHIVYTIEFYPEEGKYHFTGHRDCQVSYDPEQVAEKGVICPVCHKRMTEGVLYRVQQLAGENYSPKAVTKKNEQGLMWSTDKENIHPPFVKLVPLLEVIAESRGSTVASQKVKDLYQSVVTSLGDELTVLLKTPVEDIRSRFGGKLADAIHRVRGGDIVIIPGYDNLYGKVSIWPDESSQEDPSQMKLL